jgi:hypothetical protein
MNIAPLRSTSCAFGRHARGMAFRPAACVTTCIRTMAFLAFLLLAAMPLSAQAPAYGSMSGTVVDRATMLPLSDVTVTIRGTTFRTVTDARGTFRFVGVAAGPRELVFQHLVFGEHVQAVDVPVGDETQIRVSVTQAAIQLEPVRVEAPSELERRRQTDGHGVSEIRRPAIDEAARRGLNLAELLRDGMPGVRIRGGNASGTQTCVEFRGAATFSRGCREITVIMDGVMLTAPSSIYGTLPLANVERLEVLSPGQAGMQYGTAGNYGVLLIETRTGPRPVRRVAETRIIPGFDWSGETQPYRWLRVAGSSFVGNAVGLGLGMLLANQCLETSGSGPPGLKTTCGPIPTTITGVAGLALPAFAGSVAARWAGGTDRSRGRIMPSSMVSSLAVAAGYLLVVEGEGERSGVTTTVGAVVLLAGTPVLLTLADRVFRALR